MYLASRLIGPIINGFNRRIFENQGGIQEINALIFDVGRVPFFAMPP
jgi:hypothetical protein